jgi:hypothetical protein
MRRPAPPHRTATAGTLRMTSQLSANGIFIAVFTIAALRGVHLGVMMFAAA